MGITSTSRRGLSDTMEGLKEVFEKEGGEVTSSPDLELFYTNILSWSSGGEAE